MEIPCKIPKVSFLKMGKYYYEKDIICDYGDIPRPFYSIGFIQKGQGEFAFEGATVTVKAGDIIFIPVNTTYISKWYEADTSVCISAHFLFDTPSPFPKHYSIPIQKVSLGDFEGLNRRFSDMLAQNNKDSKTSFALLGMFCSVMSDIYPSLSFTRTERLDERIKAAVLYIENHYNEDFSIDFLAHLSTMSVSHFHACFKAQLGCSAITYKHRIRIRNAELLLIENRLSVEEISSRVGFETSIYFRKVFKKLTGKTPKEYQKFERL